MQLRTKSAESTQGRGPLDPDAARFLEQFGKALAFPETGVTTPEETAAYLQGERSRLDDIPGVAVLTSAQRAVCAKDHVTEEGVELRTYVPEGPVRTRPVLVYLHGGGWVSGSINLQDTTCRILAAEGDLVVVNVGYRLAPEHPFPTPLDDCDSALRWARTAAVSLLGADASRLAVAGSSAGGNLAAALVLRDCDRGDDSIALQVLIYPALDSRMSRESHRPEVNGRDFFISTEQMRWYWDRYRGPGGEHLDADEYFSPLERECLGGLPPAIIVTAEFDLLRDDGIRYHERLLDSGVDSERLHYPGQIHGFMTLLDVISEAPTAAARIGALVGERLGEEPGA